MIQLNRRRITATRAKDRKFRVIGLKSLNAALKNRFTIRRTQICVALRAIGIVGGGEANRASMIGVAGGARWSECLLSLVHGSVMACQTLLIADFFAEKSHLRQVACGALL